MGRTKIEWTTHVLNPIRGCTRVSRGCERCYAERIAARFSGPGEPYEGLARMTHAGPRWTGEVRLVEEILARPLRWRAPRTVFLNSMSDLFHEKVPVHWIARIFRVMQLTPQHTYQVLTKRPERMREILGGLLEDAVYWRDRLPLPNVWLGVSAEDQRAADERIPALLETPAAVRFVSAEPLLGPIDLERYLALRVREGLGDFHDGDHAVTISYEPRLDWVICGGESGSGARPMAPDWARSIRNQCLEHGVPFHFKQWGAWGTRDGITPIRLGKKAAGRRLDGRTWSQYPVPEARP